MDDIAFSSQLRPPRRRPLGFPEMPRDDPPGAVALQADEQRGLRNRRSLEVPWDRKRASSAAGVNDKGIAAIKFGSGGYGIIWNAMNL